MDGFSEQHPIISPFNLIADIGSNLSVENDHDD